MEIEMHATRLAGVLAGVFTALAIGLLHSSPAHATERLKLKIGWVQGTPATALFVAQEKGFFEAEKIEAELIPFASGPQNVAAVAAREIQFGTSATVPYLAYLSHVHSKRQEIIAIASLFSNGSEEFLSSGYVKSDRVLPSGFFVVRKDSDIRKIEDLKGKKIAAGNGLGTSPELYTRRILKEHGLSPKDMTYTTLGFEMMPGAIGAGTVDGAFVWEPFYSIARSKYELRTLFTDTDVEKLLSPHSDKPWGAGGIMVIASREYAAANRETVVRFMRAYKRALNWTWKNMAEAKLITAKFAKYDPAIAKAMVITPGPRDGKVPMDSMRKIQSLMLEAGVLQQAVPGWPERYVDYQYLDAAVVE